MNRVKPLKQVVLPRMGPVMWALPQGYHLRQAAIPIHPLEAGMGDSDGRYILNPVLPRMSSSRMSVPYRTYGFGTTTETPAQNGDAWKKWLLILAVIGAGSFLFNRFA